jgi:hypothetical protein
MLKDVKIREKSKGISSYLHENIYFSIKFVASTNEGLEFTKELLLVGIWVLNTII